jgi:3-oxoacyl-[acyl-carrier protein] reductase
MIADRNEEPFAGFRQRQATGAAVKQPEREVDSSAATLRLTPAGVRPRRRAAAEKLPSSALRTNDSRFARLSTFCHPQLSLETDSAYLRLIKTKLWGHFNVIEETGMKMMTQANQPLAGKVALVTGGSRGIGAAIVRRLARDGADVVFSYAASTARAGELVKEIEHTGRRALAVKADQAIQAEVAALVRTAHEKFGRLDILVNSAGVFLTGMVDDAQADVASFDHQIDVNVKGVVAAVRAAVPLMTDGGRIVSIGTTGAVHIPFAGVADYVATKAAVAAYTRGWSRDLGQRNIIQPGAINTDMNPQDGPFAESLNKLAALGRYGQPGDIAAAVAFLVGPDAGYITGATLNVDGGQSA